MKIDSIFSSLAQTEKGCHIAKICTALLAIGALLALSNLFSELQASFHFALGRESEALILSQESAASEGQKNPLKEAHLFGYKRPSFSEAQPIRSGAYRIVGLIMQAQESDLSKAIISYDGGPGRVYQEGERLPGERRVLAIKENGLVLDHEGQLEFLALQRPALERK